MDGSIKYYQNLPNGSIFKFKTRIYKARKYNNPLPSLHNNRLKNKGENK